MTDLDLMQKLIGENGIVHICVMEPHELDANRFGVIRKGSDRRGFGVTLQEAFDDCKVVT